MASHTLNVHSSYNVNNYGYTQFSSAASAGGWRPPHTSGVIITDNSSGNQYRMYIKIPVQEVLKNNKNYKITNINLTLSASGNNPTAIQDVYLLNSIQGYHLGSNSPSSGKIGTINITKTNPQSINISCSLTSESFSTDMYLLFTKNSPNDGIMAYKEVTCTSTNYPKVTLTYYDPYTITYNANGGTGAPSAGTKIYGNSFTISNAKPTKANGSSTYKITLDGNGGSLSPTSLNQTNIIKHAFSHWNTKSDNSGTRYDSGANYTTNSDLTLYAQYTSTLTKGNVKLQVDSSVKNSVEQEGFVITFDSEGGSNIPVSKTTKRIASYSLSGWKNNTSGTIFAIGQEASFSENTTLYAQWETSYKEEPISISETAGNKEGYTQTGWSIVPSTQENQPLIDKENFVTTSDITLYAVWEPKPFTITLNGNGGYFPNHNNEPFITISDVIYGEPYGNFITTDDRPVQEGKMLSYWTTNADGTGDQLTFDSIITTNGDHTLYANYVSSYYATPYIYFNKTWIPIEPLNYKIITSNTDIPSSDTEGDIYIQYDE